MAYAQIFRATTGPERDGLQAKGVAHARRALEVAGDDSEPLRAASLATLRRAGLIPA